ncbi:hypothetical protein SMY46_003880 [Cronobacter turicensis]|nr:hypothetical protein [Cronobacter turicensis]ELZ8935161.1 hypothetical protein [Cronobacter dublinensis]EMA8648552.1 hypothetical protein [Cronobacter turicensis]
MSTWAGIEINGLEVESFQNHYSTWFFRNGDRIRDLTHEAGKEASPSGFIGYRASVATIRRRMILAGYDLHSCRSHFSQYRDIVIDELHATISYLAELSFKHASPDTVDDVLSKQIKVCQNYLNAIKDTELEDWIALFPQAMQLRQLANLNDGSFSEMRWFTDSTVPLLCAMLSHIPFYPEYSVTGLFNFPGNDPNHFITAFLESCPDDAVCELNIVELINAGYEDDFGDLEEIQQGTTVPFRHFRQSLNDLAALSSMKASDEVLQRMCFSSIITAMEAYLSDIMRREVQNKDAIKRRFVENYSKFQKERIDVPKLYEFMDKLDSRILEELNDTSFHNIQTARKMFRDVLLIDFPETTIPELNRAVIRRHDIVHRNGKTTAGHHLHITSNDVSSLLNIVETCISDIDRQVLDALAQDDDEG